MVGVTWVLVGVAAVLAYSYSWWRHRYWASRGVPTPPFIPFLGNVHKTVVPNKRHLFDEEAYKKYGASKFCGFYTFHTPRMFIGDPELLKHILVKDFDHFVDRRVFKMPSKKDQVMANMLNVKEGAEWKQLRSIMTPIFTSGKMKSMYPLVCQKADDLVSFCLREASEKPSIDMKFNFGRFTMDTIASCAFGIECNSFVDEKPIFAEKVEEFFKVTPKMMFRFLFVFFLPKLAMALDVRFSVDATDFFEEVARETLAARRKGEKRGDFLDLLLDAELNDGVAEGTDDTSKPKKGLDDLTIVAQSVLFLMAGYDTTASTLAFASYLLAKNQDVQDRLRQEVKELVEKNGDLTYQDVMEAKYLDGVLQETLRLYPPAMFLDHQCLKDYKLPGTDVTIEAGTVVTCPLACLQKDPKYWEEPEEFRPDRFLPENRSNITSYTHLPFGMGPRNCIAMRFALMEAKVALAKLILAAEVSLDPGFELEVDFGIGLQRPKNGVNLVLNPLKEE